MRQTFGFLSFAVVTLAFALPASAGEMEDEQEIHRIVEKRWEMQAEKKVMDGLFGPNGVTQAFSSGGLWAIRTHAEFQSITASSPNTLILAPHHVSVRFLGGSKDVAFVTYYLVGTIIRPDGDDVANYRTRASNVFEKVDGKWVISGAHYSPLFGGSGVVLN
jgi:hypothetical protein